MDAVTFADELRDDNETALSRLGSSKGLYALTGGNMDGPSVRAAAVDEAQTAARLFAEWAETESSEDAADLFRSVADDAEEHVSAVGSDEGNLDAHRPMYEVLSDIDGTPRRVGGLLARSMVAKRTADQMVGFFVGEADPSTADTFRDLGDDADAQYERALTVLDDVCVDDEDWDSARVVATSVVEAAYDNYVETLESMGVQPKNVC